MISLIGALYELPNYVKDALPMSSSFRFLKDKLDIFQLHHFAVFSATYEIMFFF